MLLHCILNKKLEKKVQDSTYTALAKLQQHIPEMVESRRDTILNMNSIASLKMMNITVQTHLHNLAKPGAFRKIVRSLLRMNNMPDVVLPDDAPSALIFVAINGLTQAQQSEVAQVTMDTRAE